MLAETRPHGTGQGARGADEKNQRVQDSQPRGDFQGHGAALIENGYRIVPIKVGKKRPSIQGWQSFALSLKAFPAFARRFPDAGVGLLTGQGEHPLCAIDIDTTDATLAAAITTWCAEHIGPAITRIGRAPKCLLLYRAAEPGWRKAASSWYEDLIDGSHRLEVLGDGQQFIAYHVHPETGEPYHWPGRSPLDLQAADLPVVTLDQIKALLMAFDALALDAGLEPRPGSVSTGLTSGEACEPVPPLNVSDGEILGAMRRLDAADYDVWIRVGMALHHQYHGSDAALGIWNEWSRAAANYAGLDDLASRWKGFGRRTDRPVTVGWMLSQTNPNVLTEFDDLTAGEPARFTPVPAHVFSIGRSAPEFIKGVLPQATLAVIYGDAGSGKTFLTLDLVAAIARGSDWRGLPVQQGRVIYIVAEGAGGFRKRLRAYAHQQQIELSDISLSVIADAPNFLDVADVTLLTSAINGAGGAEIVVIDTLAQVMPGGQENGQDMSLVVGRCRELHAQTGAMVLLVHHSGKDASRGARGWSGLRAAADAEIEIARLGSNRVAKITKLKDGEDGRVFSFNLAPVLLDFDDAETSCVVEHVADFPVFSRQPKGHVERMVLDVIENAAVDAPVPVAEILTEAVRRQTHDPEKRDRRREIAKRALENLAADNFVEVLDDLVGLPQNHRVPHV